MPKRIQLRRSKGWRKPPGAIVVSRPSIYGNPFEVIDGVVARGQAYRWHRQLLLEGTIASEAFRILRPTAKEIWQINKHRAEVLANLDRLRGKDLCCWCREDAECHATTLIELAANPELAVGKSLKDPCGQRR